MNERWTAKRELFLRHYISNGFNATAAARSAGYKHANKLGPRLVKMGIFQDRLAAMLRDCGLTREECLARLGRIARIPIVEFFILLEGGGGIAVDWDKVMNGENRDVIQEIRIGEQGVLLKGYDRLRALELAGKSYGLFVERVIEEQPEDRPLSNAVLEQAMEGLRAYERESGEIVKGWRERVRRASGG